METNTCASCGKCCFFEIPLTVLDIHRIAKYLDLFDRDAFNYYIQRTVSKKSGLFKIKKRQDHSCVFLNSENKCAIHEIKPNACSFFYCHNDQNVNEMDWTSRCTHNSEKYKLWEQAIASQLTRKYIEKNGTSWNETDFSQSLVSVYDNIVTSQEEKLKLARTPDNQPVGVKYDCERCKNRGLCADETPVTLIDIERIANKTKLSWPVIFDTKLDKEISQRSSLYKLKREDHCVFFNEKVHCSLEEAQPMHCRFTPCPQKVNDPGLYECFYLGSGDINEQFKHQVAISLTRSYIQENGRRYIEEKVDNYINKFYYIISNKSGFDEFCRRIASYRYVDDTLAYRNEQ
jgi:Fe-S-cluster containining protein